MLTSFPAPRGLAASCLAITALALSACSSSNDSQIIGGTPTPTATVPPGPTVAPPPSPSPGVSPSPTMMVSPSPTTEPSPSPSNTPSPTPSGTPMVYGIRSGNELVRFSTTNPGTVVALGQYGVNGATDPIVGLDRRPADNQLYAVTRSGRIFKTSIDGVTDPDVMIREIQPIQGVGTDLPDGRINTDFNPAANALRIIADTGLNLRVPTTALTDPASVPTVDTVVDGVMGYRQGITATAYTNTHPDTADATQLFAIDSDNSALYLQNANEGALTFVADLSEDVAAANGYDIYQGAAGAENEHYVVTVAGGGMQLYGIDPADGEMTLLTTRSFTSVAGLVVIENDPADPFLIGAPLRALVLDDSGDTDVIRSFAFNRTMLDIGTPVTTLSITGLMAGERIVGIDARTTSMVPNRVDTLYAVTSENRVVALLDGPDDTLAVADAVTLSTPLNGMSFAVDFNPDADLLRILSDNSQNLRVNLQTGRELAGEARAAGFAFVDRTTRIVVPEMGDGVLPRLPPQIVATAYRAAPTDGTFQFAIDAENNSLVKVVVPNDGALEVVGPLGSGLTLPRNGLNAADQSLDIDGPNDSVVLAALRTEGSARSALYSINLNTGAASLIGTIGATGSASVEVITVRFE